MAFKTLLQEIEDKFNEVNLQVMEDIDDSGKYYVEVLKPNIYLAKQKLQKNIFILRVMRDDILHALGNGVYKSNYKNIIEELLKIFNNNDIKFDSNVDELAEESNSSGAGAYLTPNAFGHEAPEKAITAFGMKKVNMKNKNTKALQESVYKRIMNL